MWSEKERFANLFRGIDPVSPRIVRVDRARLKRLDGSEALDEVADEGFELDCEEREEF